MLMNDAKVIEMFCQNDLKDINPSLYLQYQHKKSKTENFSPIYNDGDILLEYSINNIPVKLSKSQYLFFSWFIRNKLDRLYK